MLDIQNKPGKPLITILSIDPESKDRMPEGDYELLVRTLGQPLSVYAIYHCTDGRIGHIELYHPDLTDGDVILIDPSIKCKMKLTYKD